MDWVSVPSPIRRPSACRTTGKPRSVPSIHRVWTAAAFSEASRSAKATFTHLPYPRALKSAAKRPISRAVDRLRIPKHRAEVEVTGPDGQARRFSLFLSESTGSHGGPERVVDLLNGPRE